MILLWSAMKFIVTSILSSDKKKKKTSRSHCDGNTKGHAEDYQWKRKLEDGKVPQEPHIKYFQSWLYYIESMQIVVNPNPKKLEGIYINGNTSKNTTKTYNYVFSWRIEEIKWNVYIKHALWIPCFCVGKQIFFHTIFWRDLRKVGGNDGELL